MVGGYVEWTLQTVQENLDHLIHRVPIVQIENLPKAIKRHVVGLPYAWVKLFYFLSNVVVCYDDTHPGPKAQIP